jgi:hypothetical protein
MDSEGLKVTQKIHNQNESVFGTISSVETGLSWENKNFLRRRSKKR